MPPKALKEKEKSVAAPTGTVSMQLKILAQFRCGAGEETTTPQFSFRTVSDWMETISATLAPSVMSYSDAVNCKVRCALLQTFRH
jgi:hypothetical protein